MSINLTSDIEAQHLAAVSGDFFYPIALLRIDWPGEIVEAHTGAGNLPFDGGMFIGTLINGENIGTVSIPSEESGIRANEVSVTLYGPYVELLNRMNPDATGRDLTLWSGVTTEPGGNVLIGEPLQVFSGSISGDTLPAPTNDGSSGLIIRAKAGTHGRVKGAITHSNEEHQATYPGDNYFERNARATAYRSAPPFW